MYRQMLNHEKLIEIISIQTEIVEQGIELDQIMELVTFRTLSVADGEGACVELIDGDELVYSSVAGIAEPFMGLRLPVADSLSGTCMEKQQPLVCNHAELDTRVNLQACQSIGLESMIVMPLLFDGEAIGVLKVFSEEIGRFGGAQVAALQLLSGVISAAMYTAMRSDNDELLFKATHDSLTGIPNRSLFYDRLRQKLHHLKSKAPNRFSIISLDMDGLKIINDTLGHRAGDAALKQLSERISSMLSEHDTFSRLGGDEFAILTSSVVNQKDAEQLIRAIKEQVGKPFQFEGNDIPLAVSAGYAVFSDDGSEIEELIECADRRMYEEKRKRETSR